MAKTIAFGADHGGFILKNKLLDCASELGYELIDCGTNSDAACDYSDFANKVAELISLRLADFGVLICRTGIGASMAANKFPHARAALIYRAQEAETARHHNFANILCLGADITESAEAEKIFLKFIKTETADNQSRHGLRVAKFNGEQLAHDDDEVADAIRKENIRQRDKLELIASENFASPAVCQAQGSLLTNKYAEGYPRRRWYGGCEHCDTVEQLAIDRAKKLFGAKHANVQPHSGSQANAAVYFACLKPGDRILAMNLAHGGHLTHGHPMNFSGQFYEVEAYGVDKESECIDYDELAEKARACKPKMITAGASAYPRVIDFARMREIADEVGALLFVDMAHIAGLVAAGVHPSPLPHAHFVTTTTHKSLRGPRGGVIFCQEEFAKKIDSTVFPGVQGGPLMHVIAAKAVAFKQALSPNFENYQKQVVNNASRLAKELAARSWRIVSGKTENHLLLVDVRPQGLNGKIAQFALDRAGITVNKNAIPFDTESPFKAGGIRIGTPAVTTRGMAETEMIAVAELIDKILSNPDDEELAIKVATEVKNLNVKFPLPF